MIELGGTFRGLRIGAVCALSLSWALVAAADTTSVRSKSTHPAVPKKTASTSSHVRHSTSSTSTGAKKSSGNLKKSSTKSAGKRSSPRKSSRDLGQQKIDSERATAIQQALIREHYLTGEPAGTWDEASEEAMRRYQADHGWQNKTVPDSRALISLGLGPSKDHLLNPESAMTTAPDAQKAQNAAATSQTSPPTAAPMTPGSASPASTPTPSTSDTSSPQ